METEREIFLARERPSRILDSGLIDTLRDGNSLSCQHQFIEYERRNTENFPDTFFL